jgi:hypothetical protein
MDIDIPGRTLKLDEFNIDTLVSDEKGDFINPRIAIIAPSGSGKSWVVRSLMHKMRDIPCGVVIAPTDGVSRFFDDFVPKLYIHHEYRPNIIPALIDRQKKMIKKNQEREKLGKKLLDPRAFLIMDDCMADKDKWRKDPIFLELMNQGRHYKITFILTMQYSIGIQPELRSQFNYVFLLGDDVASNRKKIWEHWAGVFPKQDLFEKVFAHATNNFGSLVVNNRIKSMDLTQKVFWFKAKKVNDFMVGSKKYIAFSETRFDPDYAEKGQLFDVMNYGCKKQSNIIVKLIKE